MKKNTIAKDTVRITLITLVAGFALGLVNEITKEPIAQKAIPNCNITYIDKAEMKQALSGYLEVLCEQDPQSVGGALPESDFYYDAE